MSGQEKETGGVVESQCRKCGGTTGHTIVSFVEGEISKVECRVCGSEHKYRPENKSAAPKKSSASKGKSTAKSGGKKKKKKEDEEPQIDQEWLRQMEGKDKNSALSYSMQNSYAVQDLIDHPKFGMGVVQRLITPNKMDVIFQDGMKRLRCDFASTQEQSG